MNLPGKVLALTILSAGLVGTLFLIHRPPDPEVSGRLASAWAQDLLSSDYTIRGDAQTALLKLRDRSVPQIRVLLQKSSLPWEPYAARLKKRLPFLEGSGADPSLCRQRGAEMIAALGVEGRSAVPDLVQSLAYPQAALDAERALLRMGEASVAGLIDGLHSRNPEIRARIARLLADFINERSECVPALVAALADREFRVRRAAALALGEARSGRDQIVPEVLKLAKDETSEVRASAFTSLGKLGLKSDGVLAVTREGLHDLLPRVRLEAARAYWTLTGDGQAVVPILSGVLPTEEGWQAAYALGSMGPAAAEAVPALVEVLKREKVPRAFRTPPSSSFALGQIQEPAIPALEQVLVHPEAAVRIAAVLAFGFMGEHARGAVPKLRKLLHDPEREIRHVTAITLASVGAEREIVLPGLMDCLGAEDIYLRSTAAALLRQMAPEQEWAASPE